MAKNPVKITDTTLRDGHQSLVATRMRTEDMLEVAGELDKIGFHSLEVWGGATFDVMHRFLQENPFDRIRELKKVAPKTPFQMLLRGQNAVGYRNYADDVVKDFVAHSAEVGMDIYRVFDALNDPRNFETAGKAVIDSGKHFQAAISFTITERTIGGPIFNEKYYRTLVKDLVGLGAHSICIKDMAGMISPEDAYLLVSIVKETTDLPCQIHTHFTSGMGAMSYMRATDAGVDVFDCALAPFAMRSSQPAVEPMIVALAGTERDPKLSLEAVSEIGPKLEKIMKKYKHLLDTSKSATIDTNVLIHQIPGGMQSNMVNQLRAADALDRLHEVHAELPRTRKDLGTPPLVTPTSQIVGTQAVMNVLQGRYNVVSDQVRDLCYGLYGKTPTPIDPEVQKICLKGYKRGETPITGRPGDYIDPEMPAAKDAVAELYKQAGKSGEPSRDHVILYALFERTGKDYISWSLGLTDKMPGEKARTYEEVEAEDALVRKAQAGQVVPKPDVELSENARTFKVQVDGETIEVKVEAEGGMPVIAAVASAAPAARATSSAPKPAAAPRSESPTPKATKAAPVAEGQVAVTAPMPGTVLGYLVKEGDTVEAGQPVVTLEAMKMENQLPAPAAGKVVSVACESGATVAKGDQLLVIASA